MEKLRLIVLAEIPTKTRHERKVAREFAESMFAAGYSLLQEGVYSRVADGRTQAAAHERSMDAHAPEVGTVRLLVLTEQQFQASKLVAGSEDAQELEVDTQLDIFL